MFALDLLRFRIWGSGFRLFTGGSRESGTIAYGDHIGIAFPSSLLTTSNEKQPRINRRPEACRGASRFVRGA